MKLAKRRAHVFEVPIRYLPRSSRRAEDRRLRRLAGARRAHPVRAPGRPTTPTSMDPTYLTQLERTRRFNLWLGDTLRPFVGDRVLEIGAGIGTLTDQFIPRDLYFATDINPSYLHYLTKYALGKPLPRVRRVDVVEPEHFEGLAGVFDTVLMINVLEHVSDPLRHCRTSRARSCPLERRSCSCRRGQGVRLARRCARSPGALHARDWSNRWSAPV